MRLLLAVAQKCKFCWQSFTFNRWTGAVTQSKESKLPVQTRHERRWKQCSHTRRYSDMSEAHNGQRMWWRPQKAEAHFSLCSNIGNSRGRSVFDNLTELLLFFPHSGSQGLPSPAYANSICLNIDKCAWCSSQAACMFSILRFPWLHWVTKELPRNALMA